MIKPNTVRLIDENGQQHGIISYREAEAMAEEREIDLVEVSPKAEPPVYRLMDYGQYLYNKQKRTQKSKHIKTKEVQFSLAIAEHDYQVKLRKTCEFLEDEHKVKIVLRFKGREMSHPDLGFELINRIQTDVKAYGTTDHPPKLDGRQIIMMLTPMPIIKKEKKHE